MTRERILEWELTSLKLLSDEQLDKRCRRVLVEIPASIKDNLLRLPNPLNIGWWSRLKQKRSRSVKWCNEKIDMGMLSQLKPQNPKSSNFLSLWFLDKWSKTWSNPNESWYAVDWFLDKWGKTGSNPDCSWFDAEWFTWRLNSCIRPWRNNRTCCKSWKGLRIVSICFSLGVVKVQV